MPTPLRIATFNVENLFTRPKVMNLMDHGVGDRSLDDIAELRRELARATYDKAEIRRLYQRVKRFVNVIEVRGKLFNRNGTVKAGKKSDWFGWLSLKRDKFSDTAQKNTATVIRKLKADVVCLVEVEDRLTLKAFQTDRLSGLYDYNMVIDGNDQRGIDVGLLSKHPIGGVWTHIYDEKNGRPIFSRDCLEVEVQHRAQTIWVLTNHFKSKGYGSTATSNARRKSQAEQVRKILREYDLARDYVVVAGDLNDTPGSAPLRPLLGVANLYDVLEEIFPDPADRWTYHYRKNEQIDYLLVSKPLRDRLVDADVYRRGMHGIEGHSLIGEKSLPSVTGYRTSASDHGAVIADFEL